MKEMYVAEIMRSIMIIIIYNLLHVYPTYISMMLSLGKYIYIGDSKLKDKFASVKL